MQSKEGLNLISDKYSKNYPDCDLTPNGCGIKELQDAISRMEKASSLNNRNRTGELQAGRKCIFR